MVVQGDQKELSKRVLQSTGSLSDTESSSAEPGAVKGIRNTWRGGRWSPHDGSIVGKWS